MVLTVVLPVRNGDPFIRDAVHSILNQSWHDFELIVVDNCSTDSTIAIVKSFQDSRIRIVHESRLGGPIAFNSGLRVAQGRYVARMDADDIACQDRFERQIGYLETHKDIGILGSQALKIDEKGKTIGRSLVPLVPAAIRHASRHAAPFVHPTLMFRRDVWNQLGGYQEFSPGADYDMLLRALEHEVRVANLPDYLLKYRIRSASVSHRSRQHTVIHSFAIKKMRRLRAKGRISDEQAILERLRNITVRQSIWFSTLDKYVYRLTNYRNRCILRDSALVGIHLANLSIAAVSALHPQMMRALWASYRVKRIMARYKRR